MKARKSEQGGAFFWIFIVVLAGLAAYFYATADHSPSASKVAKLKMANPDSALTLYLDTAYKFIHEEPGGGYDDLKRILPAGDWQWYQDNYKNLHVDTFNISGGIDPTTAEMIAKRGAMRRLLESGPHQGGAEILSRDEQGDQATFKVKWLVDQGVFNESEVRLVKEGGLWKVSGFAGGRAMHEGTN